MLARSHLLRQRHLLRLLLLFFLLAAEFDLALEELLQQLQCPSAISHSLHVGVCGDAHDARARQLREVAVQELLRHRPGDQIARRAVAFGQFLADRFLLDLTLEAHLNHAQHVRQGHTLLLRTQQHE